ncbi:MULTISPECIES: hypothetical protein [unclassified Leucobacter]|uniref:hypothetical protein n=1 Tax=unclassified Leucobacter TaxID=2621730 RepID=UPI00062207AA|nr:hypothetical protein [Leucobacter sp. Ag1]KKI16364.1 hypothetical protein XM48_16330 [Leucobacter sp. Ag1]
MTTNPPETVRDVLVALVRTVVPTAVGYLLSLIALAGLNLTEQTANLLTLLLTTVLTAVYYAAVRWLSTRWAWFGWLLGYPTNPTYTPEPGTRRARRLAAKRSPLSPRSPPA